MGIEAVDKAASRRRSSVSSQRSFSRRISWRSRASRGSIHSSVTRFQRVAEDALAIRRTRAWRASRDWLSLAGRDGQQSAILEAGLGLAGDFGGGLSPSRIELRLWESIVVRGELSG